MKTKCLLYCTKAKPYLWKGVAKPMHTTDTTNPFNYIWKLQAKDSYMYGGYNGKIVAECEVEEEMINSILNLNEDYDEYVLISIRPQWLCKILNGDKTIEVRKKILKGMI